jgi:DNA repair protein RadC
MIELLVKAPGKRYRKATATEILTAAAYYTRKQVIGQSLTAPSLVHQYLSAALRDRSYEVFCTLYLDRRYRVIEFEETFQGTIDCSYVHPRVIVSRVLELGAAAVIFAHNHPSGYTEPSDDDRKITRQLYDPAACQRYATHRGSAAQRRKNFSNRLRRSNAHTRHRPTYRETVLSGKRRSHATVPRHRCRRLVSLADGYASHRNGDLVFGIESIERGIVICSMK